MENIVSFIYYNIMATWWFAILFPFIVLGFLYQASKPSRKNQYMAVHIREAEAKQREKEAEEVRLRQSVNTSDHSQEDTEP